MSEPALNEERDNKLRALDAIQGLTKLLITLATGTVVLSATFLDNFYAGKSLALLIIAWGCLGASVLVGVVALAQYISQLDSSDLTVRRGLLEWLNSGQSLLLFGGVALFAIFALRNVTA